jgi:hypothetical protein
MKRTALDRLITRIEEQKDFIFTIKTTDPHLEIDIGTRFMIREYEGRFGVQDKYGATSIQQIYMNADQVIAFLTKRQNEFVAAYVKDVISECKYSDKKMKVYRSQTSLTPNTLTPIGPCVTLELKCPTAKYKWYNRKYHTVYLVLYYRKVDEPQATLYMMDDGKLQRVGHIDLYARSVCGIKYLLRDLTEFLNM